MHASQCVFMYVCVGRGGRFGALRPEGRMFKSHSSHHAGTLGKSFTHSCL